MESVDFGIVTPLVIIVTIGYSWWKCQQDKTALENRLETAKEELKCQKEKIENALKRIETAKEEVKCQKGVTENALKRIETAKEEVKYQKGVAENALKRIETAKEKVKCQKGVTEYALKRLKESEEKVKKLKTENENTVQRLKVSEEKVKKLKKEKENALQRLSEIASSKLKFNNPGIVDLSDENRPNKLAEMANELYDNEWTSAFERLSTDTVPKSEGEIIANLLGLLQTTYNYCQNIAGSQRKALLDALFGPLQRSNQSAHSDCSIHVQKKLSDAQKDVATYLLKEVQQGFKSIEPAEKFGDLMDNCAPYFKKCMRLCWLMSVNDPPVIFDFGDNNFDKSRFREFTKSGKEVDFIVWPAMVIEKDGPLLQKGVWQPK